MNTTAMNPAISPAIRCIRTNGVSGFVGRVQGYGLNPAPAFGAVGAALDRYAGSAPSRDYPHELRSMIAGLPKGDIPSDLRGRVLGRIEEHGAVVEKAARIFAINAEAPFDLPAEWRWIPPGEFQMGPPENDPHRYNDYYGEQSLLETVMIGGFFMLDHPITNAEYRAFRNARGQGDWRRLDRKFAGDLQPAVKLPLHEAEGCSRWLGERIEERTGAPIFGRLPFEGEWEKAARGPDGDELMTPPTSEQAHFDAGVTRAVDHPDAYANGYGLKDMTGNVWEWTASRRRISNRFVIRGGSWKYGFPWSLMATIRDSSFPFMYEMSFGSRPVLVPQ